MSLSPRRWTHHWSRWMRGWLRLRAITPRWSCTDKRLLGPLPLQLRRPNQRLEDHAVPLRLLPQIFELLLCGGGRDDVEPGPDALEADGHFSGDAEGSRQVQVAFDLDLDALGLYPHGLGDHLARDLGAGRQSAEQQVPGAGGRAGSSDPGVSLRLVDRAADVHG